MSSEMEASSFGTHANRLASLKRRAHKVWLVAAGAVFLSLGLAAVAWIYERLESASVPWTTMPNVHVPRELEERILGDPTFGTPTFASKFEKYITETRRLNSSLLFERAVFPVVLVALALLVATLTFREVHTLWIALTSFALVVYLVLAVTHFARNPESGVRAENRWTKEELSRNESLMYAASRFGTDTEHAYVQAQDAFMELQHARRPGHGYKTRNGHEFSAQDYDRYFDSHKARLKQSLPEIVHKIDTVSWEVSSGHMYVMEMSEFKGTVSKIAGTHEMMQMIESIRFRNISSVWKTVSLLVFFFSILFFCVALIMWRRLKRIEYWLRSEVRANPASPTIASA